MARWCWRQMPLPEQNRYLSSEEEGAEYRGIDATLRLVTATLTLGLLLASLFRPVYWSKRNELQPESALCRSGNHS